MSAGQTFKTMDKQQITTHYAGATKPEKDRLTKAARNYLKQQGFTVSRQALELWRESRFNESKLHHLYLKAYQYAIKQAELRAAQQ